MSLTPRRFVFSTMPPTPPPPLPPLIEETLASRRASKVLVFEGSLILIASIVAFVVIFIGIGSAAIGVFVSFSS